MKKSDLKSGMVVKFKKDDSKYILIGNIFCNIKEYAFLLLDNFDDDMKSKINSNYDVDSVYECKFNNKIASAKDNELNLVWQRDEIDWSKVPFGTKVKVWDFENDVKLEGKFLGYNEEHTHPYNVFVGTNEPKIYRNCELIEEPVTYEEIYEKYTDFCDKWNDDHKSCHGCENFTNDCTIKFVLNNYNVTRK